jgi:hypothetical protein
LGQGGRGGKKDEAKSAARQCMIHNEGVMLQTVFGGRKAKPGAPLRP